LQEKTELPTRPFTFGAFAQIVGILGGKLEQVILDEIDVKGQFYHTRVTIRQKNDIVVADIRPSDAFALAIACDAPILIADLVFRQAARLGWTDQLSS
jgi:bifunctional DNase/RNase